MLDEYTLYIFDFRIRINVIQLIESYLQCRTDTYFYLWISEEIVLENKTYHK